MAEPSSKIDSIDSLFELHNKNIFIYPLYERRYHDVKSESGNFSLRNVLIVVA